MRDRHGSPFEHNSMTFFISAPIFVFREFMRHRVGWSYNEESGRYRELQPVFYVPGAERKLVQQGRPGKYEFVHGTAEQHKAVVAAMEESYAQSYAAYQEMLAAGVAREVARATLPVGLFSSMYATCNARSLMHFLGLRTQHELARVPSFPQREIEMVGGEDGGGLGGADAAHPRGIQRERPSRPAKKCPKRSDCRHSRSSSRLQKRTPALLEPPSRQRRSPYSQVPRLRRRTSHQVPWDPWHRPPPPRPPSGGC